jgi:hypothetical protein
MGARVLSRNCSAKTRANPPDTNAAGILAG